MTSPTPSQPTSPDRRSGQDRRLDQQQVGGDHYSKLTITPWEALEAWLTPEELRGYFKGEAIVYIAREMSKAGPLDISKARHVLQKLEEVDKRLAAGEKVDLNGMTLQTRKTVDPDTCEPCLNKPCQRLDSCPFGLGARSTIEFAATRAAGSPASTQTPAAGTPGCTKPAA